MVTAVFQLSSSRHLLSPTSIPQGIIKAIKMGSVNSYSCCFLAASLPLLCGSLCSGLSPGAWQGEFNISAFGSGQLAALQPPCCSGAGSWPAPRAAGGTAAQDTSQDATGASPGTGATSSLPADHWPSGEVRRRRRRRRAVPAMLRCRRGTNCSAAIAAVSLCRPPEDLSPRLVLRACLLLVYEGFREAAGTTTVYSVVARACIRLWWVTEHSVPRAAVLSPAASVYLAVCPAAAVASCPVGREKPCNVPPSWDVRDSSPRKYWFGASFVGLGVSAATVRAAATWTQAPEPGLKENASLRFETVSPCSAACQTPECRRGVASNS